MNIFSGYIVGQRKILEHLNSMVWDMSSLIGLDVEGFICLVFDALLIKVYVPNILGERGMIHGDSKYL